MSFALAACVSASMGCSLWLGLEPLSYDEPDEPEEAPVEDAGPADGGDAADVLNTRD